MGEETTYDYDAAGNLKEKIDAKDQKTEYGYDDAGRLVTIMYYGASGGTTAEKTVAFTYDATGNLTGYDDGVTSATGTRTEFRNQLPAQPRQTFFASGRTDYHRQPPVIFIFLWRTKKTKEIRPALRKAPRT